MFKSFFPSPRAFFTSAGVWGLIAVLAWYFYFKTFGAKIGLPNLTDGQEPIISLWRFVSAPFLWFYIYYFFFCATFALFWHWRAPHKWSLWSVVGSMVILFVIYFDVEVNVIINDWYGPIYNMIQEALKNPNTIAPSRFYAELVTFIVIALFSITVNVLNSFFLSHYLFRWRQALNDFYTDHWSELSHIEGASQRVQEDTKSFATTSENLASSLITAIMTLIAFLPVLANLSSKIKEVPLLGNLPYSLVWISLIWSIFGTGLLALIGIKLPGLEFKNQRVEAAYRKELVLGEDDKSHARPIKLRELFANLRKNYFTLYFNFLYFNVGRYLYLQTDAILYLFVMTPSIAAGAITFGVFQQARSAFGQVRDSMQYLVKSWTSIIEWISIFKRLRGFEATLKGRAMDAIEQTVDAV